MEAECKEMLGGSGFASIDGGGDIGVVGQVKFEIEKATERSIFLNSRTGKMCEGGCFSSGDGSGNIGVEFEVNCRVEVGIDDTILFDPD
ncbi:MAG: hypothetical protein J7642_05755 [Cyanobacteria bacterium SBC]|nr:hypothetical protein [Cyanobacteria bacterium SBC]